MILIFSEPTDISTNKVISYLSSMRAKNVKVLHTKGLKFNDIKPYLKLMAENKGLPIWFRRGSFEEILIYNSALFKREREQIFEYLLHLNTNKQLSIGSFSNHCSQNKLIDMSIASDIGIDVPDYSLVFDDMTNGDWLLKALENISITYKDFIYHGGNPTFINLNESHGLFFPSMIQKYIPKIFEVRTFFLKGVFYSMAIFSQKDEKTKHDYRNYNKEAPNRTVPFKLPLALESKLHQLVNKLKIDTCSIDLIFSVEKKFIFLEANRMGQFDWLSGNCNYYIEKKIAYILNGKA